MELTLKTFLIVCPLIFLGSFVDAIAGGGGLITLPAYLLAGVPVHGAIATNKLSSSIGTTISTVRYCRRGFFDLKSAIPSVIAALVGSSIGAALSLRVSEKPLQIALLAVLPVVAFFVLKNKQFASHEKFVADSFRIIALITAIAFIVGMYDGFYGPGTGTFLLLLFTSVCKMDLETASGNVKLINLASNVAALVTYLINGKVLVLLGLVAAVFSIGGHYVGAGMMMKKGTAIVKPIIIAVLVILFTKIILQLCGIG